MIKSHVYHTNTHIHKKKSLKKKLNVFVIVTVYIRSYGVLLSIMISIG